jgi:pilus assembly protein CpaB
MSARARATLFLALAAVSAVVALFVTRVLIQDGRQAVASATAALDTEPILVARASLNGGEALLESQLELVNWPSEHLPDGHFKDASALVGRVLRRSVQKDEPLLESALSAVGAAAGLGSLIGTDRRAMAVKVDSVAIVAGFVTPGSSVDVIATVRRDNRSQPYTGVILQDLRVLAIDQKLEQAGEAEPELASVVTLEVTPAQAQKLAYAVNEGSLQLVLRNPMDERQPQLPGITGKDVIPEPPRTREGNRTRIEAIRGGRILQETL